MPSKCAPFSIRNRIESTPMSSLLRWPFCWIERWRRNSSRYNWTSPLKKHGNRCEPCALSTSTLAMAREKDLSPRVALAPPESCDFSISTIATRTPERRTTRLHSDTFRNAFHSFQSFSGHTRKHELGMTAPVESLISPRTVAVGSWDIAGFANAKRKTHNTTTRSVVDGRQYWTIGHLPL